jgi:16S rRNA (adenine1518-N6/adenine1519-N6)-dimethyltransferase
MRWTRKNVADLLRERGIRPRRALGQNFLVDENFLDALVRDAEVGPADDVVEIGAGIGNVTSKLAERARHVWAFEIDPRLAALARELLVPHANLTLVNADGADFERHVRAKRARVVSNLPYVDWERLLLAVLSAGMELDSVTIMVQRDLGERLRARPGTKPYGPLPALLQAACEVKLLRRAPKEMFHPAPRVESVVLSIRRRERLDFEAAADRLRALFAGRRKKTAEAGGRRVEQLAPAELLSLARGPARIS